MFFSKLQLICHCRLMISTQLTQLSWLVAKLSGGEMTGNRRKSALYPTIRNVPSETLPKKLKPLMKRYTSNSLNFQIILLSHSNSSVQAFFNKQRKTVKYGKKFHFILSLKGGLQRTRNRVLERNGEKNVMEEPPHCVWFQIQIFPVINFIEYALENFIPMRRHNFGRTAILFASYFHLQRNDTFIIIIAEIILVMYALWLVWISQ